MTQNTSVTSRTALSAVSVREGPCPLVISLDGCFDAEAEAELETVMQSLRRSPRDVVFDVSAVESLDVSGLLLLADHAMWLRSRSCAVTLRGAQLHARQLAHLLGYEHTLGLTGRAS